MKDWLENPKNKKIILIVSPIILIAAIVLVLVEAQVINFTPTPPPGNMAMAPTGVPSMPPPGGVGGPSGNTSMMPGGNTAMAPRGPVPPPPGAGKPGPKPVKVAVKPAKPGKPDKAAKPVKVAAKPPAPAPHPAPAAAAPGPPKPRPPSYKIAGTPKFQRPDPFKPYKNIALVQLAAGPAIPSLPGVNIASAPPTMVDNGGFMPTPVQTDATALPGATPMPGANTGLGATAQPSSAPTSPWRVAGIMMGAGIKAIIVNGSAQEVVAPGQPLPDNSGEVIAISQEGVTIRTSGAVKTDIKLLPTDDNSSSGGTGGPNAQPAGPPPPGMPMPIPQ